jgi:hypothetical protein
MKKQIAIISFVLALTAGAAFAQVHVRGHYNPRTGTYIAPHSRTAPDHSRLNNWSTRGNYNPFTGKRGTTDPLRTYRRRK